MKRVLVILGLILLIASQVFAAGSAVITKGDILVMNYVQRKVLTIAITAGTSGAFTDSTINASTYQITGWYLYSVETIPGVSVPPGAAYTITLKDADGLDLAAGLLSSRSTTATELINIGNSAYGYPMVRGNLTLGISGLTTTAATTTIRITFVAQ